MIKQVAGFFDKLMRKYTPDPFILAIFLTVIMFCSGLIFTSSTSKDMLMHWGDGFWALIPFTLQMVMIFVTGFVVAGAPIISKFMQKITKLAKTPGQAVIATTLVSLVASWFNWGFGLVVGGLFCRQMIRALPKANFRLLVASSYSGWISWHGGLSGSIPLDMATPNSISEKLIGYTVGVEHTLFSPMNICAVLSIAIFIPLTTWLMGRGEESKPFKLEDEDELEKAISIKYEVKVPAEYLEQSRLFSIFTGCIGFLYLFFSIYEKTFNINLNSIIFIFLFLGILLHRTPKGFMGAISMGARKVGPILLQFPFYAGIMGMMKSSGLAVVISKAFVSLSTAKTFPLLTFYCAGLINLFIPSGGAQWVVQSPISVPAAAELGVSIPMVAMSIAWGDVWTNLLQPFWALPLLAIAGIKLRDIMGYCITTFLVSGLILTIIMLVF